jgi:hypothetical protein
MYKIVLMKICCESFARSRRFVLMDVTSVVKHGAVKLNAVNQNIFSVSVSEAKWYRGSEFI